MEGAIDANSFDSRPTVVVKGPHYGEESYQKKQLLPQLEKIPKHTPKLLIDEDTPSDIEWAILGQHFSHVNDLHLRSGRNEELNDRLIPSHWPLERLILESVCAEVTQTPFILEGRVKRLCLLSTSGLRFEGPTSEEFFRLHKEAVEKGDIKGNFVTAREGTPEEHKIEVINLPDIVAKWMNDKYSNIDPEARRGKYTDKDINLRVLEILENDAIDTFTRLTLARDRLVLALDTLSIRSTHGLDFYFTGEGMFSQILPQLVRLQKFVLAVSEIFVDENFLPDLYKIFPPNLSTLRFRGPVSLTKSEQWADWIKSFENPEYLPNLKTLSFVLDLTKPHETRKNVATPEEVLREAKVACNQLYAAAEKRGVKIEPFYDEWAERYENFSQVDERWESL